MEFLRDSKMLTEKKMISIAAKDSPFMDEIKASNTQNVQKSKSVKEKQVNWGRGELPRSW